MTEEDEAKAAYKTLAEGLHDGLKWDTIASAMNLLFKDAREWIDLTGGHPISVAPGIFKHRMEELEKLTARHRLMVEPSDAQVKETFEEFATHCKVIAVAALVGHVVAMRAGSAFENEVIH